MTDTDSVNPASIDALPDATKQIVYDELGHQIEKMDVVIDSFEENGLTHTDAFDALSERRARFCTMRGRLRESADAELRSGDGQVNSEE